MPTSKGSPQYCLKCFSVRIHHTYIFVDFLVYTLLTIAHYKKQPLIFIIQKKIVS